MVTGMPALAKHIAMPPPIVPAPMTAAVAIGRGFVFAGHARNSRRLALGEEDVALRLRLVAGDQLAEQLAFALQPFLEGQGNGVAHRLDAVRRARRRPRSRRGQRLGGVGKALGRSSLSSRSRTRRSGRPSASDSARKSDRAVGQIALDDFVDDPVRQRFAAPRSGRR